MAKRKRQKKNRDHRATPEKETAMITAILNLIAALVNILAMLVNRLKR